MGTLDTPTCEQLKELLKELRLPTNSGFPLRVAGTSTSRFDPDGRVAAMKIDSWSINGNELNFLLPPSPDVALKQLSERAEAQAEKFLRDILSRRSSPRS